MQAVASLLAVLLAAGVTLTSLSAQEPKRTLKADRTLIYHRLPPDVNSLAKMLGEGIFYGRLRLNTFRWDWKEETSAAKDNWAVGLGASLTYKSAYWHGFGFTLDGYTSQNPWHMDKDDIKFLKAGKDVLSRYDVYNEGDYHMNVLAQAYAELRFARSSFKAGRQKVETLLTKSNDTKMIPNTFEGYTLTSRLLPKSTVKLAYLTKQKLRDHTRFHDVITYKDADGDSWGNNDDAGVHRGLRYDYLQAAGKKTDHDLLIAQIQNRSLSDLSLLLNYTGVPELFYDLAVEAHYTFKIGEYRLVPGFRYLRQFDDGGGKIGGASVKGALSPYADTGDQRGGYADPRSLDGWLMAVRVDLKSDGPWKWRLGYSHVGDEADIVAPWRGFPTGGFTRAMGQYNWTANTDTLMLRGDYDFAKAGLLEGLSAMFRLAYEDYDQRKFVWIDGQKSALQPTDRTVLHLDAIYNFLTVTGLQARLRAAFVKADRRFDGVDPSYNEYRFEMNYLF